MSLIFAALIALCADVVSIGEGHSRFVPSVHNVGADLLHSIASEGIAIIDSCNNDQAQRVGRVNHRRGFFRCEQYRERAIFKVVRVDNATVSHNVPSRLCPSVVSGEWKWARKISGTDPYIIRRRLAVIGDNQLNMPIAGEIRWNRNIGDSDFEIRSQFSARGITSNPVRAEGGIKSSKDQQRANGAGEPSNLCPPAGVTGCIRRFPLGAQIVLALILAGAAGLSLWRASAPLGMLAIGRGDIVQAVGYGLLGLGLITISFWVWMWGG